MSSLDLEFAGIEASSAQLENDHKVAQELVRSHHKKLELDGTDKPSDTKDQYIYYRDLFRLTLMRDAQTFELDLMHIIMLRKLDQLVEKATNMDPGYYHYNYTFISTVADMTYCIKDTRGESIANILALWLVPAGIKSCQTNYMTSDRVEYVLKLAKENGFDVQHC